MKDQRGASAMLTATRLLAVTLLTACSTPQKLSPGELQLAGAYPGAKHWETTDKLHRLGYACFVSGAKRERFSCSKTVGVFPTCSLHINFTVNDQNEIVEVTAGDPVCIGTP